MKRDYSFLLAHPRMVAVSPEELAVLPSFTRHYVNDGIGVIPVKGFLCSDLIGWFGLTYSQIDSVLKKFENDPNVKSVLLSMDSIGGDAAGCPELAEAIKNFSKPIETYIEAEASSAAYYLAAATDFITIHKSAFAGSIGSVISAHRYKDMEVKILVSEQTPHKVSSPWDDEGQKRIISHLNKLTDNFINDIAAYRNTNYENVKNNFGQGDVLFAPDAVKVGMVDQIGNFQTALIRLGGENVGNKNIDSGDGVDSFKENNEIKNTENEIEGRGMANMKSRSALKNRKIKNQRGKRMGKRIKNAFVLIDESEAPDDATTIADVTIESLEQNFPDLLEEVRQKVKDEIVANNGEVEEAAAAADMADEEEVEAVAAARKGEITPAQLTQKLLVLKTAKLRDPKARAKVARELEEKQRAEDNPEVGASVGNNGTDLLDQDPKMANGKATASRVKNIRNKKKGGRK